MDILNTILLLVIFIGTGYFAYMSSILVSEKKARYKAGTHDYYDNPINKTDDWDTDMEFSCSYMGVSRFTCNERVCEKSLRIGE